MKIYNFFYFLLLGAFLLFSQCLRADSSSIAGKTKERPGRLLNFSERDLYRQWRFITSGPFVSSTKFYTAKEPSATDGWILVVEARKASGMIMSAPVIELDKTPVMHWRWRIIKPIIFKKGKKEPDDQACVVYAGTGDLLRQDSVAYSWECCTEIGAVRHLRYNIGLINVWRRCLRNSSTPIGEWVEEYRNVADDYLCAYKKELSKPFILSIGGNSQYTNSHTRIEIDYIEFLPQRSCQDRK